MSIYVDIKKSLGDFSLAVELEAQDEILGLLGASGCGKSMTLKCIAGIIKPDSGKIVLNNRVLFDSAKQINLTPQERKTGYLFQNYALFPHMTVEENIAAGIQRSKPDRKQIVQEKIASFYLAGLEKRYPGQISGGQQQRVALARIFAAEPDIIMLDEPFSALDNHLKWQIELETMKVLEKYKDTIIFVSHSRDEVYRLCDRTAVLTNGKIEQISAKKALFNSPETLAASRLTGCKNHSKAEKISDYTIRAIDWNCILSSTIPVPDNIKYVGIRAHYLKLCLNPAENSQVNCLNFEIERVIEDTFSMMIIVRNKNECGLGQEIVWQVAKDEWQEIHDKQNLRLQIPDDKLLFLK
ncbi:MAG: sulfate/molybdate ABC transporter ATP-binding protein [Pelosinus sp.]|nr:sulfate/molybdate ABC transporter ATP-binding protein [Pelosinus sp.]